MGTQLRDGNIGRMGACQVTIDAASVAANTSVQQTFTVLGLKVGDFISIQKPSTSAGLTVTNPRVSADNTLALTFGNHTGIAIDPAAEIYRFMWFRPEVGDPAVLPGAVQI